MRIKKELVVLVVIIILLSAYLVMRSRDRTHYTLPVLPVISSDEISKIEIDKPDSSILLQKYGEIWKIVPQEWPVEDYIVNNMLEVMENLTFTTLVSESKHYERYGLTKDEKLTIRAWVGDSLKREFEIGKTVPASQHTFVKLPSDHRVYHAQNEFRWKFDQTIEKLRAKTILSFDEEKIQEISIKKDKDTHRFIRKMISFEKASEKDNTKEGESPQEKVVWVDSDGGKLDQEKVEDLLRTLSELECKGFIDGKEKKDFKNPICDVLIIGEHQYSLSIYTPEESGVSEFPGISSESPYPFLLSADKADEIMSSTGKKPESADEKAG